MLVRVDTTSIYLWAVIGTRSCRAPTPRRSSRRPRKKLTYFLVLMKEMIGWVKIRKQQREGKSCGDGT